MDKELKAVQQILAKLKGLNTAERSNVLAYVNQRVQSDFWRERSAGGGIPEAPPYEQAAQEKADRATLASIG